MALMAGKKIKGRKEHIIVDTPGLPMAVKVHTANIHDSVGAVRPIKTTSIYISKTEEDYS